MYRYLFFSCVGLVGFFDIHQAKPQDLTVIPQEISNGRTHGPNGPRKKPEDLIAQATYLRGPLVRSHSIFDGTIHVMLDVNVGPQK